MSSELPTLEPDSLERAKIAQLQQLYPALDYYMCLCLVKTTKEQLDEIVTLPFEKTADTSTLVKNGFSIE